MHAKKPKVTDRNIFDTFLTSLAIQACNVFTGIITARLLQPEGRGELATVILWPSIIGGLGILGTNWALAREAAAHPENEADLARTAVVLGLVQAFFCMFLGYFLVPYFLPADKAHLTWLTRLYLFWLPLNFVALNLLALDHGRLAWKRYNLVRFSFVAPYLILLAVFWMIDINRPVWFVAALLFANFFTATLRVSLKWKSVRNGRTSCRTAALIIQKGLPFFMAAAAGVIALQLDKALVVSLLSTEAVGIYAAAFTFASAHSSLGNALGITSFAALANISGEKNKGHYLASVFRQATLLYLFIGLASAFLAPLLIVPFFGKDFSQAVHPAAVLVFATSVNSLAKLLDEGLRGSGYTFPGICGQLIGAGVIAFLAFFWIPSYGLTGLSWAATIGGIINLMVIVLGAMHLFKLDPSFLWGLRYQEAKFLVHRIRALFPKPAVFSKS